MGKWKIKKINLAIFCLFYLGAGINHFWHPINYLLIIPPYFPFKECINYTSGFLEICCSLLMLFSPTKKFAMYLTILLLIAFIPAHIYLIQLKGCASPDICFPELALKILMANGKEVLMKPAMAFRASVAVILIMF